MTMFGDKSSAQAATDAPLPLAANPGRPTVSTPATLTPIGHLRFENGSLYGRNSGEFSTRTSANQVTKLSVSRRLEFLLLSEPIVGSIGSAHTANRPGEVFAGAQGMIFGSDDAKPTLAVSYIRRLHQSPAPELDTGTFRQSATLLLSADFAGFHADTNAIFAEQVSEPVRRAQLGQTRSTVSLRGTLQPTP